MDFDNASMEVLMAAEVMAVTVVDKKGGTETHPEFVLGAVGARWEATVRLGQAVVEMM